MSLLADPNSFAIEHIAIKLTEETISISNLAQLSLFSSPTHKTSGVNADTTAVKWLKLKLK